MNTTCKEILLKCLEVPVPFTISTAPWSDYGESGTGCYEVDIYRVKTLLFKDFQFIREYKQIHRGRKLDCKGGGGGGGGG